MADRSSTINISWSKKQRKMAARSATINKKKRKEMVARSATINIWDKKNKEKWRPGLQKSTYIYGSKKVFNSQRVKKNKESGD